MPVPKLLNAKCDLKVTTNDLNVKCAIARFQSLWAFKLSCCTIIVLNIGFLKNQQLFWSPSRPSWLISRGSHLKTCHEDWTKPKCKLHQRLAFWPPKRNTYVTFTMCMICQCVYYLQLRATKVLFGNFHKVVSPPPPPSRSNSFLSRMSKLQPFSFKLFLHKICISFKTHTLEPFSIRVLPWIWIYT